jgi:hypothetical protein
MGMWMYVIPFLFFSGRKNLMFFFIGIMAELATAQALFRKHSLLFYLHIFIKYILSG